MLIILGHPLLTGNTMPTRRENPKITSITLPIVVRRRLYHECTSPSGQPSSSMELTLLLLHVNRINPDIGNVSSRNEKAPQTLICGAFRCMAER